jgi:hypothetical protein
LASGIYLLSSDGKEAGWIRFLHNSSIEDESDNNSVNIFLGMMMWRLFSNGDIKVEMMSLP